MKQILIILGVLVVIGAGVLYAYGRDTARGLAPLVTPSPSLPQLDDDLPFSVPDSFAVSVFSSSTPGARVITFDPRGVVVVSLPSGGKIVALPDRNSDARADGVETILENLDGPHGIAFQCAAENDCTLFVAEENAVKAYAYNPTTRAASAPRTLTTLPAGDGHATRSLQLHPDGRLLVSVGSSCNVCVEKDARRAIITAINLETGTTSMFATGLRNTVFTAVHPVTGDVWGTDMGRDLLGDDTPPEEINILKEGGNYGWPYCYGKNTHDTEFDSRGPATRCSTTIPSHIDMQAHSAPLGIAFVPEEGWPEEWWHDALVAFHGSWNRSVPTGYKVVRIPLDAQGKPEGTIEDFMTGFMTDGTLTGRPVGLLVQPGGTFYLTDDRAGAVYRVYRIAE